jgi:multidrug efflux system membrane fusion protein
MDDTVDRARLDASPQPMAPVAPAPEPPQEPQQPTPRRRLRLMRWLVIVVLAVAAIFGWEQFQKRETEPETAGRGSGPPAQTVRDAEVTTGDVPIIINALGAVTPLATITIRTQVNGQLQKVGFEEGQMVKAGDFLAQVDPRPFEATAAQAKAQLAKDTALRDQAQADFERYQMLNRQDSIAKQQVEDQQFLVKQDQAAMANDQAQIDAATLNINYAHIIAPVSGRVGLRQVDPGNYVQPTDPNGIVLLTQLEPISVIFTVAEDYLPQIQARMKTGATLPVAIYDRSNVNKLQDGHLAFVDNQIDVTTGTVKLRALFDNKDDSLFPQQFVNARLTVDTMKDAVVAPNAAIQQGAQGPFVYIVNDDTVSVRQIKTGPVDGQRTAILSGLKAGERVVIDGVDRLRDGAKVAVRNGPAAGAPGATGGKAPAANPAEPDQQQGEQQGQHRHRRQQGGQSDQ